MDLRVVFLGVCLCASAVTYSRAGIPTCCMSTRRNIPLRVLSRVQRWEVQHSNGACDIPAVILYVKNAARPICAPPTVTRALKEIQKRRKRSQHKDAY